MAEVILYVIPGCRLCRQTREYLRRQQVPFAEINALDSPKSLVKLPSGFRPEFPVVTVNARVLPRVNRRTLAAALNRIDSA